MVREGGKEGGGVYRSRRLCGEDNMGAADPRSEEGSRISPMASTRDVEAHTASRQVHSRKVSALGDGVWWKRRRTR